MAANEARFWLRSVYATFGNTIIHTHTHTLAWACDGGAGGAGGVGGGSNYSVGQVSQPRFTSSLNTGAILGLW